MPRLSVRIAGLQDTPALIDFIRDHWSEKHIFVRDSTVFSWQYVQKDGRLNMVLAEQENEDGAKTILGVLGFIPLGRFDPALGDDGILLALWKVRDDIAPPGLGLRLLKLIQAQLKPKVIGAIGISDMVKPIYRALGYTLDQLGHWALFNPEFKGKCAVAANVPDAAFALSGETPTSLALKCIDRSQCENVVRAVDRIAGLQRPRKSWAYVVSRYIEHPWYDYALRAVEHNGEPVALVVWRQVECNGSRILRVVDIIGDTDWLSDSTQLLRAELVRANAEYIDIMQVGTPGEVLSKGCFIGPEQYVELILPNYFSPFEARNIDIHLAYRAFQSDSGPLRLYRADSDQDRPN